MTTPAEPGSLEAWEKEFSDIEVQPIEGQDPPPEPKEGETPPPPPEPESETPPPPPEPEGETNPAADDFLKDLGGETPEEKPEDKPKNGPEESLAEMRKYSDGLKAKLKELEDERTRLEERNAKLQQTVSSIDVTLTDDFQNEFVRPAEELTNQVLKYAREFDLEPDEVTARLNGSLREFSTFLEEKGVPQTVGSALASKQMELRALNERRAKAIEQSVEKRAEYERNRRLQQETELAEMSKVRTSIMTEAVAEAVRSGDPLFTPVPADAENAAEVNGALKEALQEARALAEGQEGVPPDQMFRRQYDTLLRGVQYPKVVARMQELETALAKAREMLAANKLDFDDNLGGLAGAGAGDAPKKTLYEQAADVDLDQAMADFRAGAYGDDGKFSGIDA